MESKLKDIELEQVFHNSFKLELEWINKNLNSKKHKIEYIGKGIEMIHKITSWKIDALSLIWLNLTEENFHLWEIISKKDNKIVDLSNLSLSFINNLSQKLLD